MKRILYKLIRFFFKQLSYWLAIEVADAAIRLSHWLSRNEKCLNCRIGSGRKFKKSEFLFQQGKLYSYCYLLTKIGHATFKDPMFVTRDEERILRNSWSLSTGEIGNYFISKKLFDDALGQNDEHLEKQIRDYRAKKWL